MCTKDDVLQIQWPNPRHLSSHLDRSAVGIVGKLAALLLPDLVGYHEQEKRMPTIAYLAGFFDGEGCICIHKKSSTDATRGYVYQLSIDVGQKAPAILEAFKDCWGGSICKGNRNNKRWMAYGRNALKALIALAPHLILKQAEAELAISFQREKTGRLNRGYGGITDDEFAYDEAAYHEMKALKLARK